MKDQDKILFCLSKIKQSLKQKALTYAQVAKLLEISEPSVKRQLNSDDLSLCQLLKYCDIAGIGFAQLWAEAEARTPTINCFSAEQDLAFYHHPHLYQFFSQLVLARFDAATVQNQNQLNDASMHIYLRKLEILGVIRLGTGQSVTPLIEAPYGFGVESKVVRAELASVCDVLAKDLREKNKLIDIMVLAKPLKLPEVLRQKFHDKLHCLYAEYARLSEQYFVSDDLPTSIAYFVDWPMAQYELSQGKPPYLPNITSFEVHE